MIFDEIQYLNRYAVIPHLDKVMAFLKRPDLTLLQQLEIEIVGRELFVRLMRYTPKPAQENRFETHRVYADIQVLISGKEIMQYAPIQSLSALTEYDVSGDYQFFKANENISDMLVNSEQCVVFFPGEAHRPSCLAPGYDGENFKLVFKVKMGKV